MMYTTRIQSVEGFSFSIRSAFSRQPVMSTPFESSSFLIFPAERAEASSKDRAGARHDPRKSFTSSSSSGLAE